MILDFSGIKNGKLLILAGLLLLAVILSITAFKIFNKPYGETIKNNVILNWASEANAKEYLIQIDDSPDFNSPEVEKRVSASKTKMVVSVESNGKPYYWRTKAIKENSTDNNWQLQGELKESCFPHWDT